ncbi:MAG: hypothetical protein AB8B96_19400 [Lysobacterales bacterium]
MFYRCLLTMVSLGMCLGVSMGVSSSAKANDAWMLRDGLLIDPASGQVVYMRPTGGLESVNIADGSTAWESNAADRPMSLESGEILSQVDTGEAGSMDLARINSATGQVIGFESLTLPSQVVPNIDQQLGQRFEYRPMGSAQVAWQFEQKTVSGMPAPEGETPDLMMGAFEMSAAGVSDIATPSAQVMAELWKAPASAPPAPVAGVSGRQFLAVNNDHVLISQTDSTADQKAPYLWHIYTATGERLLTTRSPLSYAPFVVVAGQLIFVTQPRTFFSESAKPDPQPLMLRAISLATGETSWVRAIRDTQYIGPYPA